MPGAIYIIQGGQWGSEGKGMVANAMAKRHRFTAAVRTGAINAGHTIYHNGRRYAMQQLPVAWTEPGVYLVIGPGAYIHPGILAKEVAEVHEHTGMDLRERLMIDERCAIHPQEAEIEAALANRHYKIGATGKGCAEAILHKIRSRGTPATVMFADTKWAHKYKLGDTVEFLGDIYDKGGDIQIEGTQGTLLDMHTGDYPFTTSRMTSAANWLAETGLSPGMNVKVVLVLRTYPIRVAGNSGPMPGEISWPMLARQINLRLDSSNRAPLVADQYLYAWEQAVTKAGVDLGIPDRLRPLETYMWDDKDREKYQVELSNLHTEAWKLLKKPYRVELAKLFEMTTVTQKLRRIATLDPKTTVKAINIERPSTVVISFLNYEFPELWGKSGWSHASREARRYIKHFEGRYGVQVAWATLGPESQHLVLV